MTFESVVRAPLYLQVAAQLREAILDGRLAAGAPLPTERELAETFTVSRASVREALRALQAQGLVTPGPSTGRTVVGPGGSGALREAVANLLHLQQVPVADLVELRCTLEVATSEAAAHRREPLPLAEAQAALVRMRRQGIGVEDFEADDVRFHVAIAEASGNAAMHHVMLAVRDAITRYLLEGLRARADRKAGIARLCDEHEAILDAVRAGQAGRASALMRAHIEGFWRDWLPGR